MKKLTRLPAGMVLPYMIAVSLFSLAVFSTLFFLPQDTNAQTRQECEKTRDRASYNCLLEFGKCYSPCVAKTKDNMGCRNSCKQVENVCDKEVDTQYKICLETLPKTKENTPTEKAEQVEAQTNPDCHEVFTNESNSCLKESTKCIDSCVDKGTAAMSLTVDGAKVSLECQRNVCDPASKACNDKAMANFRACGKSDDQPKATEAKKEAPIQDGRRFLGEWPTFQVITDWTMETKVVPLIKYNILPNEFPSTKFKTVTGKNLEETLNWQPIITKEAEQKAWQEFLPIYTPGKENITIIAGEGEIKSPASPQFIPIEPKGGDTVQVTYLDSTTRATSDAVQLRYAWSPDSGAVINIPQSAEIKFLEPVTDEKTQEIKRMLKLNKGELEVKIKNTNQKNKFEVQTDSISVVAPRTHFWISQSQDKKLAVIGVYEGEVEVKTKDGKTIRIKPDGDNPGVVVVSRKLSPVKLALAGLILAAAVGGAIMILRRKFSSKGLIKKKR